MLIRFIQRFLEIFQTPKYRISYAQTGEDLIVYGALRAIGVSNITYLDVGAHDAYHMSNTFFFYKQGHHGITIEPNPTLCASFKKARPRDTCLPVGVGTGAERSADFFVMNPPTLSTFSSKESHKLIAEKSATLVRKLSVPLLNINDIIEKNIGRSPNFISLDTEGYDLEILRSFDFAKYRPEVFCIETLSFSPLGQGKKLNDIIDFMNGKGYKVYADTYVNTIFVDGNKISL